MIKLKDDKKIQKGTTYQKEYLVFFFFEFFVVPPGTYPWLLDMY